MEVTKKIYPSADELKVVNSTLHCTEEACSSVFTSESNLNLHLVKTHRKEWKCDPGNKEFYCPELECVYNQGKFFKTLKLLKQHYLKVHGEKSFICDTCDKGFSTLALRNRHTEYCGIMFKCCNCETSYPCYESLLTHGRRKNHKILDKMSYNPKLLRSGTVDKSSSGSDVKVIKKDAILLPKTSASLQLINVIPVMVKGNGSFDKGSQTDACTELPTLKTKQTQVCKEKSSQSSISKQSQTLAVVKKSRSSAETQTIGDYVAKKPKLSYSDVSLYKQPSDESVAVEQKSIKTQTKQVSSKTKSCNTSFELDESEFKPVVQRSTSSTQTTTTIPTETLYSISTATHDSIHTDTSDLNFEFMNSSSQTCFNEDMSIFDSSSFFNCNIETQTDFMFDTDLFNYEDCYSSSHTQTTDDCSSPNRHDGDMDFDNLCPEMYRDVLFNTIHTQTALDDMARSVESQTMMSSHNTHNMFMTCRDMANIETQTDVDFKKLLEEINA